MRTVVVAILVTAASIASGQNVIIAVIDGPRNTDLFAVRSGHSRILNKLLEKGTLFPHFFNDYITLTNPGHGAILTGAWQLLANDGSRRPYRPTMFEYNRKHREMSSNNNYMVAGKSILNVFTYSEHAEYGPNYGAEFSLAFNDESVLDSLKSIMGRYQPNLIVGAFPSVDMAGHGGIYSEYLEAIARVVLIIYDLWNHIQGSPNYRNRTILLITADHGRHDDSHGGFQHHGDKCDGCRNIFLLAIGPGIPAGEVRRDTAYQIDIGPTVGRLLGYPTEFVDGRNLFQEHIFPEMWEERFTAPRFELHQNYPNPFNPFTSIGYELDEEALVSIAILDLLGRPIFVQPERSFPMGYHEFHWNGRMTTGEQVSSGVYLYTLRVTYKRTLQSITNTRKMLLLR
jgi:hypothetical protein